MFFLLTMYTSISLLFLHLASAIAAPLAAYSNYAVRDSLKVPAGWTEIGEAPKDQLVHLQIGLKPSDENTLERHLLEISDPAHPRYKQYLSTEEIATLITPSDDTQTLVERVGFWSTGSRSLHGMSLDATGFWPM